MSFHAPAHILMYNATSALLLTSARYTIEIATAYIFPYNDIPSNKVYTPYDNNLEAAVSQALSTPYVPSLTPADASAYRFIVDYFIHVTSIARPDMLYVTGLLAAAYARPTPLLLSVARRAATYLYKTRRLGLRRPTHPASGDENLRFVGADTIRVGFEHTSSSFGNATCSSIRASSYDVIEKVLPFYLTNANPPLVHLLNLQRITLDDELTPRVSLPTNPERDPPTLYVTAPVAAVSPESMKLFTENLLPSRFKALRNKVLYNGR